MGNKTLIVVCGPTASGKTRLSITLANYFDASIFSADARQFFQQMNIGTAKPSQSELSEVPHYFINNKSISESYTAGAFEKEMIAALDAYFKEKDVAILCGGSGLYIKAVTEGLDEKIEIPDSIRNKVRAMTITEMQQSLEHLDASYYASIDIQNPRRLSRALELIFSSGKKMSELNKGNKKARSFNPIYIGTELNRETLYEKINHRVDEMIHSGLKEEAIKLMSFKEQLALQTVGYKEWFDCFEGKISESKAIELIKQNTRNYAKRQMTWFKKTENINWFNPDDTTAIIAFLNRKISNSN